MFGQAFVGLAIIGFSIWAAIKRRQENDNWDAIDWLYLFFAAVGFFVLFV